MNDEPSSSSSAVAPKVASGLGGAADTIIGADPAPALPDLEIRIADAAWLAALPYIEALTAETVADALAAGAAGATGAPAGLTVLFTDDGEVAALNIRFRDKQGPTNILSFPSGESPDEAADGDALYLGDMALAYGVVAREAAEQQKSPAHHVMHLLVHGTLHLLGFDHDDDEGAARMEAAEVRILRGLGVADPYVVSENATPAEVGGR